MQSTQQARLSISRQVLPAIRKHGAERVFLAGECEARACTHCPRFTPPHNVHPQPEIFFFLCDGFRMWVGEGFRSFESGDILVMPPGVFHYPDARAQRLVSAAEVGSRPMALWITAYSLGAAVQLARVGGEVYELSRPVFVMAHQAVESIHGLLGELQLRQPGYEAMVEAGLLTLLATVLRCPAVPGDTLASSLSASPAAEPPAPDRGPVAAAKHYIHTHYAEKISVPELARQLFVSESHLSRQFRRETGMTVTRYLSDVRLGAARELLQTDVPIHIVALLSGFRDPLYFSHVFRAATGLAPTAYRASLFASDDAEHDLQGWEQD